MSPKNLKLHISIFAILAVIISVVPTFAASAVIGSIAGGTNATVGGQTLMPNTTLFSGDSLRVGDGAAVVAMGMGSRMVFGRETVASFERGQDEVTVLLGQGNVSMYHPEDGVALRVKTGDVTVSAGKGYKTLGEVAMVNGIVVVTAKEGMLRVQGPERSMDLTKGKSIAITQKSNRSPKTDPAGGAGSASSGITASEAVGIGGLAAAGLGATMGIVDLHKINQTNDAVTKTDADAAAALAAANAADADAKLANQNAIAAGQVAQATCQQISATNPSCVFTAH